MRHRLCGLRKSTPSAADKKLPGIQEFGLTEEEFAAHVGKVEATIGRCMARAGFEYVPVDVKTVERAQLYVRADPNVSRRDYHARWGYGETTRFDDPVRSIGLGSDNRRIFNNLSPADQVAYNHTLFGEDQPQDVWCGRWTREAFSEQVDVPARASAPAFTRRLELLGTS